MKVIHALCVICLVFTGCQGDIELPKVEDPQALLELPDHFPNDLTPYLPEDNVLTRPKIDLGKMLFFDPNLSLDSTVSCATCHKPELAFTDGLQRSVGVGGRLGLRNAPSLANVLFGQSFFWHGSSPNLERQVIFPIEDEAEMDNTFPEIIRRLEGDEAYVEFFEEAFGEGPNPNNITDAIAAFERTLLSYQSPYDKYLEGDTSALSLSQKRGLILFNGEKAECFHCHNPAFLFTDESFKNNGLYEVYPDPGRWELTGREEDKGKFKVPTLRNIALTAPYMHDGSIATLEEVIDHYSSGGANHPNKAPEIRRFILNDQEKQDLIQFLEALTDPAFINNPSFRTN